MHAGGAVDIFVDSREAALAAWQVEFADRAGVSGYIATVEVTQQFHNPFDAKIEAVYVFPLPENAAVHDFVMTLGERRIRGVIRERQEAERIYADAKSRGHVASLLTQERPNIFTQAVANIEPGRQIDVTIQYYNTLACVDGWYEFVFPMVVGPRYNPSSSADGIGAAPRGQAGRSGQAVEVQYLKPGERSGHDIALRLDVNAGVPVEEFQCRTHVVSRESPAPERFAVTLSPHDRPVAFHNDEGRRNDETRNPKPERSHPGSGIRHSSFELHSSFVICPFVLRHLSFPYSC